MGHSRSFPLLDRLGLCVSGLCAIHCALLPAALVLLPFLGATFLVDPTLEFVVLGLSAVIGTFALGAGFRRHHRRTPLAWFLAGIAALVAARITTLTTGIDCCSIDRAPSWLLAGVSSAGGVAIALSHLANVRALRCCPEHTGGPAASGH